MGDALTHAIVAPKYTNCVEACVDAEFVACMVCACSSVITGVKPSELFGFAPRGRRFDVSPESLRALAQEATTVYAQGLADAPVHLTPLGVYRGRQMMLCWRPEAMQSLLADSDTLAFLEEYNFDTSSPEELVQSAAERLSDFYAGRRAAPKSTRAAGGYAASAFPHEVGVLLGFPVSDVREYMAHAGGGERVCGPWKVYGDVDKATRSFARFARAKKRCAQLSSKGYSVRDLIREHQARDLR
ncbi:MAG: DUF3793 family protein [Coriobacteriales bacterium]|nr:DUF3793 family protein [Coriobacteriales bacterium]